MICLRTSFVVFILLLGSFSASGKVQSVTIGISQDIPAPRWMFDKKLKVQGDTVVQQLVAVKRHQNEKKYSQCVQAAKSVLGKAKGIRTWILNTEITCALATPQTDVRFVSQLESVLGRIVKDREILMTGPAADSLYPHFLEGSLILFEKGGLYKQKDPWYHYNQISEMQGRLTPEQRARFFKAAGELAFKEQNSNLALDFFTRSLLEKDSSELRRRVETLRPSVNKKNETIATTNGTAVSAPVQIPPEKEIMDRLEASLKVGDLLPAIEDGVKIIEKSPSSSWAKQASDRILEIYLGFANKNDGNFPSLRKKAVEIMCKSDGNRLLRWANNAFARGVYFDALKMAEAAISKMAGQPDLVKTILLAANSAHYIGDFRLTTKWFELILNEHSATEEAREAALRLGLIQLRQKKYIEATSYFERVLGLAPSTDWEYLALYWVIRAQQKIPGSDVSSRIEKLLAKYPLTYYGLRVRAETSGQVLKLDWIKSNPQLKTEIWLSESQNLAWERFQVLLKAGWFDEAQDEIAMLPEPLTAEDKVIRAKLFAHSFDHVSSVRLLNDIWSKNPEVLSVEQLRLAFPFEFQSAIETHSQNVGLEAKLIRSLIRQESTFKTRAQSTAGALGVMQLLPGTAQEVAQSSRQKGLLILPDDLFSVDINIKLGAIYLSRLIRSYKGNIPLALAAYNAGTGRLRKWIASRTDLGEIESQLTSDPEAEIWIDELPWEETTKYIKSILRNYMIYSVLEKGEFVIANPLWKASDKAASK